MTECCEYKSFSGVICSGYITEMLDDAKVYSAHANKKSIDVDDVKLAVQCKLDHSFTNPPPREVFVIHDTISNNMYNNDCTASLEIVKIWRE